MLLGWVGFLEVQGEIYASVFLKEDIVVVE